MCSMDLDVPIAIHAQLLNFPDGEKATILRKLELLAAHPDPLDPDVRPSRRDPQLWTVRLSERLDALLRVEGTHLKVLAVASREQMTPYLEPNGKRVA
jgi:hypothetical protein